MSKRQLTGPTVGKLLVITGGLSWDRVSSRGSQAMGMSIELGIFQDFAENLELWGLPLL